MLSLVDSFVQRAVDVQPLPVVGREESAVRVRNREYGTVLEIRVRPAFIKA